MSNQLGEQPRVVTCQCQHCTGHIEFDANELNGRETATVECPHCIMETIIVAPRTPPAPPPIPPASNPTKPTKPSKLKTISWIVLAIVIFAVIGKRTQDNTSNNIKSQQPTRGTEPTVGNILDARSARNFPPSMSGVAHGFEIEPRFYGIKYFAPNPHPSTPAEIVTEDFHRMLGRDPDEEALAFWISRGSSYGRFDNSAVCNGITVSEECIHLHHPRQPGYEWSPSTPYVELNDVLADLCEQGIMPSPTAR
jgi:hypothetical protein